MSKQNTINGQINLLTTDIKTYLNLRLNLIGLVLSKRIATLSSLILTALIITGLASLVILMLSFAFVFWYGQKVGAYYQGFLIMALAYALVGLIVFLGRKKFFVDPVIEKINEKLSANDFAGTGTALPTKAGNIDDQIIWLTKEVDECEKNIQADFESFTDSIQPSAILKNLFTDLISSPTLVITLIDLALKFLRKNKKEDGNEQP